jgi:hypothetical protein
MGGYFIAIFTVGLNDTDISNIAFYNWKVGFKAVDMILYMQNKNIKRCKVRVPSSLLWVKEMPVDDGPAYAIRQGINDADGKPIFWLDYEAVVKNPNTYVRANI